MVRMVAGSTVAGSVGSGPPVLPGSPLLEGPGGWKKDGAALGAPNGARALNLD